MYNTNIIAVAVIIGLCVCSIAAPISIPDIIRFTIISVVNIFLSFFPYFLFVIVQILFY